MNRHDFFEALSWPKDQESHLGWALWTTSPLNAKGLRATAIQDPHNIRLTIETWGTEGSAVIPLDAVIVLENDQARLSAGSVFGQAAGLEDVLREFGTYVRQINQEPTFQLIPPTALKTPSFLK